MACISTCRPPFNFFSLSSLPRNPKIPQNLPFPTSPQHPILSPLFSPPKPLILKTSHSPFHYPTSSNDNNNNNNNNNGSGGNNSFWGGWWWHDSPDSKMPLLLLFLISRSVFFIPSNVTKKWAFLVIVSGLSYISCLQFPCYVFAYESKKEEEEEVGVVYEVRGGKWTKLVPDPNKKDMFVVASSLDSSGFFGIGGNGDSGVSVDKLWLDFKNVCMGLLLPDGFPNSVTSDYLEYSLWRGVQGVASQISGVLATQALLYAVGLGKGAIPTAAAVNWVLKDGIGYISKIFLSKFGRHFDVHPRGWRLFADLLENTAFGMEMLTPAFPHLFVFIGAVAGAGRSAAALIQSATRSCFYAGFAAQRNFAEVIAKGEAQGMVSKSIGIVLGIAIANRIGSSIPLALAFFTVVTWVHMFCNLKSYQSIQLRTLNPYRGSLVFSEYLLSGQVPPVKEVNDEEPLFPGIPFLNGKAVKNKHLGFLSLGAKNAAAEIVQRLQLGSRLSDVISNKEDAIALFDLYRNEGYILTEDQGRYLVVLKENCSQQDMLKSLFHVNYLYWLEKNAGIMATSAASDCRRGGRLRISLDYVQREFKHAKDDAESVGWVTGGLIARPLPNRIRPVPLPTSAVS